MSFALPFSAMSFYKDNLYYLLLLQSMVREKNHVYEVEKEVADDGIFDFSREKVHSAIEKA